MPDFNDVRNFFFFFYISAKYKALREKIEKERETSQDNTKMD